MTTTLSATELHHRLGAFTVVDVREPGEYAGGHVPGAVNVPLGRVQDALPELEAAAERGELALVCASGNRSGQACAQLEAAGIAAANVTGGTAGWIAAGYPVDRVEGARQVWPMDRQVRLVAGSIVLAGLLADIRRPGLRWVSAGIGAGLTFSAVTNTCGMAAALSRLPYNRPAKGAPTLEDTLAQLRG